MKFTRLTGFMVVVSVAFAACTHLPRESLSRKAVARHVPSKWYDGSYAEYFDAYGPVRTIKFLKTDRLDVERTLIFNNFGRLIEQKNQDSHRVLEIHFNYLEDGRLQQIKSFINGSEYRLSEYVYTEKNDTLQKVRYFDYVSGREFHTKHNIQSLDDAGWFTIDKPVEQIDLPSYKQFDGEGRLVWDSQSGFNHGPGRQFYIDVKDSVSNARVVKENTPHMRGIGGYSYEYDTRGRLSKIISNNGNNNHEYHTTTYWYNEQGLLRRETQVYTGRSLFNESLDPPMNTAVTYQYHNTDEFGNWTHRTVVVGEGQQQFRFDERRIITYYQADHQRVSMQ